MRRKIDWLTPSSVGIQLAAAPAVGWFIGHKWLDVWFQTYPVFTIIFTICGMIAGFRNLFKEVAIQNRKSREAYRGTHEVEAEKKPSDGPES